MAQFKDGVALLLPIYDQSPVSPREDSELHHVHLCSVSGSSPSFSLSCSIPDRTPPTSSETVPTPITPIPPTLQLLSWSSLWGRGGPSIYVPSAQPLGCYSETLGSPRLPRLAQHHQFGRKEWTYAATSHLQRCSLTLWPALTVNMISLCVTDP